MSDTPIKKKRKKRNPRKITPSYLNNYAMFYLERFSSSSANLKKILMRRVHKSVPFHGEPTMERATAMVDDVVAKLIELKIIDDALYAKSRTTSFRRAGNSKRQISAKLFAKGLDNTQIHTAIETVDQTHAHDNPELTAAIRYAQRRRIGPYRSKACDDPEQFKKDLAKLARNGFSFDIAKQALNEKREKIYY